MTEASSARLTALAFALASVALVGAELRLRRDLNRTFESRRRVLDAAEVPKPLVARLATLGHTEWATDLLWVNAIVYYGETLLGSTTSNYVRHYAVTMQALDPDFRPAYLWGAMATMYRITQPTRADAEDAVAMLTEGHRRFPHDAEIDYNLASTMAFELGPRVTDAERPAVRARAAEHMRRAALAGVGPAWLPLTASAFLVSAGRLDAAVDLVRDALLRPVDGALRAELQQRLDVLLRRRGREDPIEDAMAGINSERLDTFPYLTPPMYTFVGTPVIPRVPEPPRFTGPLRDHR
ncbi:MAG: hypothetical protein HY909_19260 [Deltaproteobacteria bacterium]|nr:hypothetical protein [Deltaproteobacteria bacterium]